MKGQRWILFIEPKAISLFNITLFSFFSVCGYLSCTANPLSYSSSKQEVRASKTLLSSSLLVLLAVWVLVHFFPKNKTAAETPSLHHFRKKKNKQKEQRLFPSKSQTLWSC
jgi:hypothetical protein